MKLTEELLKKMEEKKELYADGIIMPDGDYRLITDGHLKTLMALLPYTEHEIWKMIPEDDSALFWLVEKTGCDVLFYSCCKCSGSGSISGNSLCKLRRACAQSHRSTLQGFHSVVQLIRSGIKRSNSIRQCCNSIIKFFVFSVQRIRTFVKRFCPLGKLRCCFCHFTDGILKIINTVKIIFPSRMFFLMESKVREQKSRQKII